MAGEKKQMSSARKHWMLWLLTPCIALAGTGYYLLGTTSGLVWMAGIAERQTRGAFKMEGMRGSLLNGFGIGQLTLLENGVRIDLQEVHLDLQLRALIKGELNLLHFNVGQIDIHETPTDTPASPPVLPTNLQLPLTISAAQIHVDALRWFSLDAHQPDVVIRDIEATLFSDQQQYRAQLIGAQTAYGQIRGVATLASSSPYVLTSNIELDGATPRAEPLSIKAEIQGELQHLAINLNAQGAGASAIASMQIEPLNERMVRQIKLQFNAVDAARWGEGMPRTRLSGEIALQEQKNDHSLEGDIKLRNELAASPDHNGIPLLDASARVNFSEQHVQFSRMEMHTLFGGILTGNLHWDMQRQSGEAGLVLNDVDLQALDSRMNSVRLSGTLAVDGVGQSQHAVMDLTDGVATLSGEVTRQGNRVELHRLRLARGDASVEGSGELALDGRRAFRFDSHVNQLNLADFSNLPPTVLNAQMDVVGELSPHAHGELVFNLYDSRFAQYDIGGKGRINYAGGQTGEGDFILHLGDNQLTGSGSVGLGKDQLRIEIAASDLSQIDALLGGSLKGYAELSGSLNEPILGFNLNGQQLRFPESRQLTTFDASGSVSAKSVDIKLAFAELSHFGKLLVPQAHFELQGIPAQHTIVARATLNAGEQMQEELNVRASGGLKGLDEGWRMVQWQGSLEELAGAGAVSLRLLAPTPITVASQAFDLGKADFSLGGGTVRFNRTKWSPGAWQSDGNFGGIGVRAVNAGQANSSLDSIDTLRFGGIWNMEVADDWNGLLQVQRESGDWTIDREADTRFGLKDLRLTVRARQDRLQAQLEAHGDMLGEFKAEASLPLTQGADGWQLAADAPLAGHVLLDSKDMSWLGPAVDSNFRSGGQLKLDAELLGTWHTPRLRGEMQGEALGFAMLDQGVKLQQGQLKVRFAEDILHIDLLDFDAPYLPQPKDKLLGDFKPGRTAGKLSASGLLDLNGLTGGVQIGMQKFPLLQRSDRWVIASGKGLARYSGKTLMLNGDIRADAGLIDQPVSNRPQLAEDVQITGKESTAGSKQQNKVSATLDLGDYFFIRASGLEARLAGKLDVRGEPGEPLSVVGVINAQDATFETYGQKLQVERGMVNFQGQMDDPGLNILAYRKGLDVEAGVEVTGTARKPVVRLVSIPNVPDAEKLSWLVLGRVPDSSGLDSSLLLSAATNIMGGQSASQIGRALGVDEISLKQQAGGDPLSGQIVTVGKRLNSRAFISYEQGFAASDGVTKFTYTLTPRITIVTRTGVQDAIDMFYSFRFY